MIITDTREQKPLWGNIFSKLEVGDYSLDGYENEIAIERKSLPDLFHTLGQGHKRFKNELERADKLKYFAIVVEGTYTQALKKYFDGSVYSQMKGSLIVKIMFTLHIKYGINIFFCDGRAEAKKLIQSIFDAYLKTKG